MNDLCQYHTDKIMKYDDETSVIYRERYKMKNISYDIMMQKYDIKEFIDAFNES